MEGYFVEKKSGPPPPFTGADPTYNVAVPPIQSM
jgi:hypothetical protein